MDLKIEVNSWIRIIEDDIRSAKSANQHISLTKMADFESIELKTVIYYRLIKHFESCKYQVFIKKSNPDIFILKWDVIATPKELGKMARVIEQHIIE